MPIEGLAARYRELGRLKFGEDLGDRPAQLETWRITSPDPQLIQAAAERYGGTPTDNYSEVITETNSLEVLLPPQDLAAGQWYEAWGKGGLIRRCTGTATVEVAPDGLTWAETGPCGCDPERRECKLRTVLRVLLPDLPDIGIWRLSTGSLYAATELPPAAEAIQRLTPDYLAPAVLALEARETKKRGQERHHYIVPVLRTATTLRALLEATAEANPQAVGGRPVDALAAPADLGGGSEPAPPTEPPAQDPQNDAGSARRPDHDIDLEVPDQPPGARRAAQTRLAEWLDEIDGSFSGTNHGQIVATLEILEGMMIEAGLWKEGALDAASQKGGLPFGWRESAMTPDVKTFATRAVIAATAALDTRKRAP